MKDKPLLAKSAENIPIWVIQINYLDIWIRSLERARLQKTETVVELKREGNPARRSLKIQMRIYNILRTISNANWYFTSNESASKWIHNVLCDMFDDDLSWLIWK